MPHNRYFIEKSSFHLQEHIEIREEEHHHLSKVMRMQKGDPVEIVNGCGDLATGPIVEITKTYTLVNTTHLFSDTSLSNIILCQALPKFPNLQWIVEKCTELGVDQILLFPSDLAEKYSLSTSQLERLKKITIAALKQCGRLLLPEIVWMPKLSLREGDIFFGDLEGDKGLYRSDKKAYFINGPEKGFSKKELSDMRAAGYIGARLAPHILRTETAAIAATSQLQLNR